MIAIEKVAKSCFKQRLLFRCIADMTCPDPRTTPEIPIQEIPNLSESITTITADQLITKSISLTSVSREQLLNLTEAMELPIGNEIIGELFRAIQEPRTELDTSILTNEQIAGCFTRMRDRRLHAVGEGRYEAHRKITLTPTASNLSFVSVHVSADEKDKKQLAVQIEFNLPFLAPDQRSVVPEFVQSVFSVLGFSSLPPQPNLVLNTDSLADADNPSFRAQLSPQCSAMYVINDLAIEDEPEEAAATTEESVFTHYKTFGVGLHTPTIEELRQLTADAGLVEFSEFDTGQGDGSFFAKTLEALTDDTKNEAEIWEMFSLQKCVLIQFDLHFDIGSSTDADAADERYQMRMEIDGPYISFTQMSITEPSPIVEIFVEEQREDIESSEDEPSVEVESVGETEWKPAEGDGTNENKWKDVKNSPLSRPTVSARLVWEAEASDNERWQRTLHYVNKYGGADRETVEEILKQTDFSTSLAFDRVEILLDEPIDRSLT